MLEGIRVVELGVWVAGPSATGLMADWGADVIKVEAPGGDPFRRMFAVALGHGRTDCPPFDLDNRGKRSVVLDLGSEFGREAMHRLVESADVFVTNLRPEAVARLGLDAEKLLAAHPRLIYATVTGYGRDGPDAGRAGYDVGAFWARSGLAATALPPGEAPPGLRGGVGDHVTGIATLAGILAALVHRERTGRGQVVESSLLRTGMYCLGWDLSLQLRYGKLAETAPRRQQMNPLLNCYRAADDRWFWLLGVEADRHWPQVLATVDRRELADDERFSSARARRKNAEMLVDIFDEVFATQPRDEWVRRFDAHDVWWAPVNTPADVLDDPQAAAGGGFVDVPEGGGAPAHRSIAPPVEFSDADRDVATDGAGPRPVPALGEHTEEVLRSLGLEPPP